VIEPVLAPEGNYDKRICHAVGQLVAELAETDHGHSPDFGPEEWVTALRATAQTLLAYDPDTASTVEPAREALRWVADNLAALWD
jgi:hypothetical protein